MYEKHFGLDKRPFSAQATGPEVFVGPQTAKTMAGFRKALAVQDAVVTVSGQAGTGKTTLVERALDAIGSKYKTIRVGRVRMNASDVLESLLIVLGVEDRPTGTIQRFTVLRKKLADLQAAGTRVFILVEDALRAGADTLAELEALTDGDAGESDGASIVLMGDDRLFDFMKDPQLARLQQRVRQRHRIKPLCVAELRGYMKHSLRMAGGDFEQIFAARSAELLHELSDGIPRVANNLADAVLEAAAAQGASTISTQLIAQVADDDFGLSVEHFDFSEPVAVDSTPDAAVEPIPADEPPAAASADTAIPPEAIRLADQAATELTRTSAQPAGDADVALPADSAAEENLEDPEDIPHLIQDTLPDLAILSQRYATLDVEAAQPEPAADTSKEADSSIPELTPEPPRQDNAAPPSTAPAGDGTESEPAPSPAHAEWELSKEPEFALVTEVVPALDIEDDTESSAKDDSDGLPVLQTEETPAPEPAPGAAPAPPELQVPEVSAEPPVDSRFELTLEPDTGIVPVAAQPETPATKPDTKEVPAAASAPVAASNGDADKASTPVTSARNEVPEWDRDPTLAELKPDLDALEQAMAFTQGEPLVKAPAEKPQPEKLAARVADSAVLPEITLDKSIETGIDNLEIEEPSDILPPKPAAKSDPELERIAADIANAKSLEDIDDLMAETLFGTGISMIAEQITANPPTKESANDVLELLEEPVEKPPVPAAAPAPSPSSVAVDEDAAEEISIETKPPVVNTGLDLSASQRLKTVRALNADMHPTLRDRAKPRSGKQANPATGAEPEPIEDQINTSITQTLKALKLPPDMIEEQPEEEVKKGFLSRFRRS